VNAGEKARTSSPATTYTPARIQMWSSKLTGSIRTYRAVTTAPKSFCTTASPSPTFPMNVAPSSTGVHEVPSLDTDTLNDATH